MIQITPKQNIAPKNRNKTSEKIKLYEADVLKQNTWIEKEKEIERETNVKVLTKVSNCYTFTAHVEYAKSVSHDSI